MPSSKESSWPRDWTRVSYVIGDQNWVNLSLNNHAVREGSPQPFWSTRYVMKAKKKKKKKNGTLKPHQFKFSKKFLLGVFIASVSFLEGTSDQQPFWKRLGDQRVFHSHCASTTKMGTDDLLTIVNSKRKLKSFSCVSLFFSNEKSNASTELIQTVQKE